MLKRSGDLTSGRIALKRSCRRFGVNRPGLGKLLISCEIW